MPDQSDRPPAGSDVLILPAVFVPDGESPPPDFITDFRPLILPVSFDPSTGELTGETTPGFLPPLEAMWHPDLTNDDDDENLGGDNGSGDNGGGDDDFEKQDITASR